MRLILVHGVGNPVLGELVDATAQQAAIRFGRRFIREDVILPADREARDRRIYPCATDPEDTNELIEVNWSDLRRPAPGVLGVLKHVFLAMFAMVSIGASLEKPNWLGGILAVYRWVFTRLLLWSLLLPILVLPILTAHTVGVLLATCVVGFAAFWGLAEATRRVDPAFRAGRWWAVVFGLLGIGVALGPQDTVRDAMTRGTAWLYTGSQITLAVLLSVVGLLLIFGARLTRLQRLAYCALLYVPFLVLSGVGALAWSASLATVKSVPTLFDHTLFDQWAEVFTRALHYDLRMVEVAYTWAIGGVFASAVLLGAGCWVGWRTHWLREAGKRARDGLAVLLYVSPAVLSAATAVFLWSAFTSQSVHALNGAGVLDVYETSARRLVPLLLYLMPGLRTLLDVLGDVIFFLADGVVSIRVRAVERVVAALQYARDHGPIVILSHSQGTVLAVEAMMQAQVPAKLVTVGSPIDSLYRRFLGWQPSSPLPSDLVWLNGYRDGDYVGGPVDQATNVSLGRGGHVGYWTNDHVWNLIKSPEELPTPLPVPGA